MENQPLVSVIVPIYNVEKYLEQCIISIVHQTYKNLEIILVNDGSPDNSLEICNKWSSKDQRIKVIDKENGGLSDARNTGLREAVGEYVSFVDSDDWISINMIENMVKEMEEKSADLVVANYISVTEDGHMSKRVVDEFSPKVLDKVDFLKLTLENNEITSHVWRRLYRRKNIISDIFPKGKNFEDIYSAFLFIDVCDKIVVLSDAYYFYRINDSGIVKNITYQNCKDHYEASVLLYDNVARNYPELKDVANINLFKKLITVVWRDLEKVEKSFSKVKLQNEIREKVKSLKDVRMANYKLFLSSLELNVILRPFIKFARCNIYHNVNIKKILRYLLMTPKRIQLNKKLTKSSNYFYILGAPRYGNLGDLALLEGERTFIKKYFPNYRVREVTLEELYLIKKHIKAEKSNNIFAIQAGGNIGSLYPGIHLIQEKTLNLIKSKNLMIFPQTFYYDTSQNLGKKLLKDSKKLYSKKDIQVFVRDYVSYEVVRNAIQCKNVNLVPDIALMLNGEGYSESIENRRGAFLCLRNDSERTLSNKELDSILIILEKIFESEIEEGDTHRYNDNIKDNTFEYVKPLLKKIGSKKLMLTDRLHGMVFAAITSTPCIVITSKSPKVKGVYNWIKELPYIKLVDDISEIESAIQDVLSVKTLNFENTKLEQEFEHMAAIIKEKLGE